MCSQHLPGLNVTRRSTIGADPCGLLSAPIARPSSPSCGNIRSLRWRNVELRPVMPAKKRERTARFPADLRALVSRRHAGLHGRTEQCDPLELLFVGQCFVHALRIRFEDWFLVYGFCGTRNLLLNMCQCANGTHTETGKCGGSTDKHLPAGAQLVERRQVPCVVHLSLRDGNLLLPSADCMQHLHENPKRKYVQDNIFLAALGSSHTCCVYLRGNLIPYPAGHRVEVRKSIVDSARRFLANTVLANTGLLRC